MQIHGRPMEDKRPTASNADQQRVLAEAVMRAGKALGLSSEQIAGVVGKHRTSLARGHLSPDSKQGELGVMLVRVYRSLYALMGGDVANMQHFMVTPNQGTGGVPVDQIRKIDGLYRVMVYLDAMRGRA